MLDVHFKYKCKNNLKASEGDLETWTRLNIAVQFNSSDPHLPLSLSFTVRQVCLLALSLAPAVTPPLVFLLPPSFPLLLLLGHLSAGKQAARAAYHEASCSSPADCAPVNQQQHFLHPNNHLHPHFSCTCCSPYFGLFLLHICVRFLVLSSLHSLSCCR